MARRTSIARLAGMLVAAGLALGAQGAGAQWDPVFRGPPVPGIPDAGWGLLFGSLELSPRDDSLENIGIVLQRVGDASREFAFVAPNRAVFVPRSPDMEDDQRRVWVFSGPLPAGRYEIARARLCNAITLQRLLGHRNSAVCRDVEGTRPVLVDLQPGQTLYLGRWHVSNRYAEMTDPVLAWRDNRVFLLDRFDEDSAVLERQRQTRDIFRPAGGVDSVVHALPQRRPAD